MASVEPSAPQPGEASCPKPASAGLEQRIVDRLVDLPVTRQEMQRVIDALESGLASLFGNESE